jgi:quinol monooxygenase YgiN
MARVLRCCANVNVAGARTMTIRAAAHEACRRELQQALVSWAAAATADGTVRSAHVCEDVLAPGVFGIEADMDDGAGLDAHLRSAVFGALMGALTVLARDVAVAIRQPVPAFGTNALELIRRIRGHSSGESDGDS